MSLLGIVHSILQDTLQGQCLKCQTRWSDMCMGMCICIMQAESGCNVLLPAAADALPPDAALPAQSAPAARLSLPALGTFVAC